MEFGEWYSKTTSDGGMDANHMRRYHKKGFNPKTDFCKYLNGEDNHKEESKVSAREVDTDIKYYTKKFESISYEEAKRYIEEVNGAKVLRAEEFGKNQINQNGFLSDFKSFWESEASVASEEEHQTMCRMAATVLKDLNTRFGYNPRIDFFVPVRFRESIGGATTPDHINCTLNAILRNAHTISIRETDGNWGHNDERLPFEIIAHEIGHALTDETAIDECIRQIVIPMKNRWKGKSLSEILKQELSPVAETSKYELIADVFARITSPSYKKGEMPEECEDFVFNGMNWRE